MITIPELNSVSSISDNDLVMITHSNGTSEKITGANFKAVINNLASSIADTKIAGYVPGLDAVTTLADTDVVMVTHSDQTSEKITGANLKAQVLGSISDLTAETTLADSDIVYIKQTGGTLKKMTGASLKAQVLGSISDLTAETTLADTDIVYIKKQDGTLKKMTLANLKGSPVPLGTEVGYDGNTDPADGQWLIEDGRDTTGTDKELETYYPSLYTFLGGTNVLPEIFDHSKPGVLESISLPTTSATAITMQYDGELIAQYRIGGGDIHIYVNGTDIKWSISSGAIIGACTIPFKKGDVIYCTSTYTISSYVKYYKQHKIIKATASTDSYTPPSSEIQEIESYFDQGINTIKNNGLSYSTTETWTGGYWYDGKKIYKQVVTGLNISVSRENWTNVIQSTTVDTLIKGFFITESNKMVVQATEMQIRNGYIAIEIFSGGTRTINTFCYEYTKTTD